MRTGVSLIVGLTLLLVAPITFAAGVAPTAPKVVAAPPAPVPAQVVPPSGDDHLAKLDHISQGMENMIAAQGVQVNILACTLAFMGLILTIGTIGLFVYAKKKIKQAVTSSAFDFMKLELGRANAHTNNLNCILNTTLLNVARDLAYTSKMRVGACIEEKTLDLSKREDVNQFLDSVSDTFLTPLHIFSTISELAASRQQTTNVREKVYILYAEVSAGNIAIQSILPVVAALKEILIHNESRSPAIELLKKFETVLRATPYGENVPGAPPF